MCIIPLYLICRSLIFTVLTEDQLVHSIQRRDPASAQEGFLD
jgi:hypothetical protein